MEKFSTKNGQLVKTEIDISGRKFSLLDLRKKFLTEHEQFMRLQTNAQIDAMSLTAIQSTADRYQHQLPPDATIEELRTTIKNFQRSRSLILWHDHGTILGLGCILITVHIAYDPAVFYTQSEYEEKYSQSISIQSLVERPKLHIIAAGSSSIEHQIAIIQDRIDCLYELDHEIVSSNGVVVQDTLKFFIGDHPAKQFERGTQQGGRFKCGGCGTRDIMFADLAHTLQQPWRSLQDLQSLATAGKFGKIAGNPKPFENLRIADLREELHARGDYDTDKIKDELQKKLDNTLCGIQRVPTMLLLDPKQSLTQLHLEHYTVLDSEPLHDLKGHFHHLFAELPYLLTGEERSTCEAILAAHKDTMTGAKCRVCMIEIYLYLLKQSVSRDILLLIETAVRISEILYMNDTERNTRNILRLYNCTWLHHELCKKIITRFHSGMTYNKLFGSYLHALVVHAPQQLEIISLRSVNTENQERLFEQARRSATAASNRHPGNVLSSTVLRLQAKATFKTVVDANHVASSIVARAGKDVPKYQGTNVTTEFIISRKMSWQNHLQRVSHYLLPGKEVWWKETQNGYLFLDADDDPVSHAEGPCLRHHRSTSMADISKSSKSIWKEIVNKNIDIPTPVLQLYNDDGTPSSKRWNNPQPEDNNEKDNAMGQNLDNDNSISAEEYDNEQNLEELVLVDEPDDDMNTEPQIQTQDDVHFQTKHATEIAKVLGTTEDLKEFDKLRRHLKDKQKVTREDKQRHQRLLYKLQLAVQQKRTTLLKALSSIEKEYYLQHCRLPEPHDSTDYEEIMTQCRHINKLLRAWNLDTVD